MHNPSCDLKIYVNGEFFASERYGSGYDARRSGLQRGLVPAEEDMKKGSSYRLAALDLGLI